ncbi:hypothetical protein DIU31_006020 [Mucilaginibacter rubeus]|uniref:Uncharacterized protein n=2 Tax=Mucilaginibacter rubeus TaxID=2027860 RepID=A0AAE6MHE5_9SPHI|nr:MULTISPECIES: hypothetical protein [Mucilaginibacter]QEM03097.1 hypothetical protein DIU31_006020 [Mucilaginibacter rubeus]QEM15715.1 hypothetical protein DIU38_006090 [Mucilaginibacter gossypii]QTE41545.1 hypothetical protein J3L19_21690 [Mucilaginibacter rubeus]QTE48151.1 hypothetical protein J3L21_21690 [Mucilaginibacter rubeus]QTE59542.1 hypothetical protein J3L23_13335 [Mucilaginibacter rubeus]
MVIDEIKPFTIEFKGQSLTVSEHYIGEERIFRILFEDKRKPLTLAVGINSQKQKFWTSIPQGRQEEAGEIGPLIAWYYKEKKK